MLHNLLTPVLSSWYLMVWLALQPVFVLGRRRVLRVFPLEMRC